MDYQIKFDHISDLADARFAASVQATWFGFSFGFEHDLQVHQIQEIINWCNGAQLCLQLHASADLEKVVSYCSVLSVAGIECSSSQFFVLNDRLQNIHFLINDNEMVKSEHNTVQLSADYFLLEELSVDFVVQNSIKIFSIACKPLLSVNTAEKDQEHWFVFFENLGII